MIPSAYIIISRPGRRTSRGREGTEPVVGGKGGRVNTHIGPHVRPQRGEEEGEIKSKHISSLSPQEGERRRRRRRTTYYTYSPLCMRLSDHHHPSLHLPSLPSFVHCCVESAVRLPVCFLTTALLDPASQPASIKPAASHKRCSSCYSHSSCACPLHWPKT